jgi:hypothetical protein
VRQKNKATNTANRTIDNGLIRASSGVCDECAVCMGEPLALRVPPCLSVHGPIAHTKLIEKLVGALARSRESTATPMFAET